ncbi:MAG: GNAT family N-acetyltransferase [Anaerolineales bacterium]|nr:GNAT family N-acetyltransferase [Anaerolineales bacterium]
MASAVRQAVTQDAHRVVELVQQLAATIGEDSPVSATTVEDFLAYPGSGVLLAEEGGRVVGLLSYSVRPNLYHAANVCLIEDLIVDRAARGRGIGSALVEAMFAHAHACGCAEVSVTTMPDNTVARSFYQRFGLVDEAIYLEKHLHNGGSSREAQ